jgi:succinylarginine dihydrolase
MAAAHLSDQLGRTASAAETARATSAWWAANAAVIGPDPDVLLPGQVLRPPPA